MLVKLLNNTTALPEETSIADVSELKFPFENKIPYNTGYLYLILINEVLCWVDESVYLKEQLYNLTSPYYIIINASSSNDPKFCCSNAMPLISSLHSVLSGSIDNKQDDLSLDVISFQIIAF